MKIIVNKNILLMITVMLVGSLVMCSPPGKEKSSADKAKKSKVTQEKSLEKKQKKQEKSLRALSEGDHRSAENIQRNQYRNPVETLIFFEVKKNMKVVEIWPSRGWYTEIIAPFVNKKGQYYAAGFAQSEDAPEWRQNIMTDFEAMLKAKPEYYKKAIVTELAPPEKTKIAPVASADRVLTFRNVHNWMKGGYSDEVFTAMFKALKPGGVLGVVEHRAKPGTELDKQIQSGYVTEEHVKALAAKAGFEFVESSEVNANPKDTADHPKGVWTLPPSLRLGDQDRGKYIAIGESDRMTLKFRKPL